MAGGAEPSKLYLVLEAGPAAEDRLVAALAASRPASLLIKPAAGKALGAQEVLRLIKIAQDSDVAVLLADDAALVRVTKADGVHLSWSKDILARAADARDILGNRYMLGADVGRSRHDAMELGEAGADYVAFGIPGHVEDRETAQERREELCNWWGEIFQIACVAFDVDSLDEAERLISTGADFVALALPSGGSGADIKTFMEAAQERLAAAAPAAT